MGKPNNILPFVLFMAMITHGNLKADENKTSVNSTIQMIYDDMLIGETFPSGKVYLEKMSVDGGYDNVQNFDEYTPNKILTIYLLEKLKSDRITGTFQEVIKNQYIGDLENHASYFSNFISKPNQDALFYQSKATPIKTTLVLAFQNQPIKEVIRFDSTTHREASNAERSKAEADVKQDALNKAEESTLAPITLENTIIYANKLAYIKFSHTNLEMLLSVYRTQGYEYVSEVYVTDFIQNGKVIKTLERRTSDGPY